MPIQVTTDLPDEDQPVLGNGVEDEIAVDRESAVSNYGSVRIQVRETGEATWDSSATEFGEFIGAYDTLSMEFVGREDGEEYEVRARTETEHVTGTWTPPVSIITQFPGVTGLAVTSTGQTTVGLEGQDNADNEDGFRILRQREYSYGWGPWQEVADIGPHSSEGTLSITDDTASPGNTYRYKVEAYTQYASANSNTTDSVLTTDSGRPRTRTGSRGWHVEVDHPSGRTLRPQLLDDPTYTPVLNDLPRVEIPVPRSAKWESDDVDGAPMRVWKDGRRLPIDELQSTSREPSQDVLHGVGGLELDQYIESVQFDERDSHVAAKQVISEEIGYVANVDDPASNVRGDVRMQSADFSNEFEAELSDPSYPFPDERPVELWGGHPRPQQTGWFQEAEDTDHNATVYIASEEGNEGAWSGENAVRLRNLGEELEFSFTTHHVIPQDTCELTLVFANPDTSPELTFYANQNQSGDAQVAHLPEDFFVQHTDEFDLHTFTVALNQDGDLNPGTHSVRIRASSTVSEGIYTDFCFVHDNRYPYAEDIEPTDGVVTGWWQYPTLDFVFKAVNSVEQVIGGRAEIDVTDTSNEQAVAIRNGTNDWVEDPNSETVVVEEFGSGEQSIQLRVTIGGTDTGSASGDFRAEPQELREVTLWATLDDTPVLLDKAYSGTGVSILNRIADTGPFVWEVRQVGEETTVEWTQPGQRTTSKQLDFVDFEGRRTIEESYERIIVEGESKSVEDERFEQDQYSVYIGLDEQHIQTGSETVYDPGDPSTVYERGVDYGMDWYEGSVELLDGGSMSTNTEYAIDYSWKIRGEYELPDAEEPRTREFQIPEASTEREADQFARGLVKELQDPLEEATATISEADPEWSLVEALGAGDLPFSGPLEVRGIEQRPMQVQLRLGTRQSVGEVVDELRERIDAVARQM